MALIKNPLSGGGGGGSISIVNGVIEQYKADSGTVEANTFIEKVYNWSGVTVDKTGTLASGLNYQYYDVAVLNSSVAVVVGVDTSYNLFASILTISGNSITEGTRVILASSIGSNIKIVRATKTRDNQVFAVYTYGSNMYLYGIALSVSGSAITAGTATSLSSTQNYGYYADITTLADGKVFVSHPHSNNSQSIPYGMVCMMSGANYISNIGTDTQIGATLNGVNTLYAKTGTIDSDNALITGVSGGDSGNTLYGVIATISNTTITVGTNQQIKYDSSAIFRAQYSDLVVVSESMAFYIDNNNGIKATPIIISSGNLSGGNRVKVLEDTKIDTLEACFMPANTIFIGSNSQLSSDSGKKLYGTTFKFDNSGAITVQGSSIIQNSGAYYMFVKRVSNTEILAGAYTDLYSLVSIDPITIKAATNPDGIQGLTATACTDTTAGSVWVLDTGS